MLPVLQVIHLDLGDAFAAANLSLEKADTGRPPLKQGGTEKGEVRGQFSSKVSVCARTAPVVPRAGHQHPNTVSAESLLWGFSQNTSWGFFLEIHREIPPLH